MADLEPDLRIDRRQPSSANGAIGPVTDVGHVRENVELAGAEPLRLARKLPVADSNLVQILIRDHDRIGGERTCSAWPRRARLGGGARGLAACSRGRPSRFACVL